MSVYKQYKTNTEKEVTGVPVEVAVNDDKTVAVITISRMGQANKAYTKMLDRETKPYRRQIEMGSMSNDLADKIFKKVFAATVIKGWVNMRDENDVELPFNEENAIKVMDDLPELYAELQEKAKSASMFRDDALEAEAKN